MVHKVEIVVTQDELKYFDKSGDTKKYSEIKNSIIFLVHRVAIIDPLFVGVGYKEAE